MNVVSKKRESTPSLSRSSDTWAGVRLSAFTQTHFCDVVVGAIRSRSLLMVTFLNPFYARATDADPELAEVVDGFDIVQPDGWGVVYGARFAGIAVPERVAIEDVEGPLFEELARMGCSVYLFGSEPGVADAAAATLTYEFPGLRVAGTQHGWLDVERGHPGVIAAEDACLVAERVRASDADLVLVGLPTPLQQQWAARYGPTLGAPVVMTVGAYFDKLAEGLAWYPAWMGRARLGWLYRVYREPRRLIPRYTIGSAVFAALVVRHVVAARRGPRS